ncbi:MAG TPA: hypothetical protein VGY50_14610 [Streptosporangiaceae bacterium]|jgi:hypothetical protein|nr:hypothetical protein [Streptosporangiaceae bacterium]
MTTVTGPRRFQLARPATAGLLGTVLVALAIAAVPLSRLAQQSLNSSGGSVPVWFSAAYGAVGLVVAWRKPGNPLGWIFLLVGLFSALAEDASFYMVADYRLRHGSLPLGWAAVLTQPGWAPMIALMGVAILLFPDGRLPSRRWRWVLWAYLAMAALWVGSTVVVSVGAIAGHHIQVDSGGDLLGLSGSIIGPDSWFGVVQAVFFPLLTLCWLLSVAGQAVSYRRSSGERRQQLKWLLAGAAAAAAGLVLGLLLAGAGLPGPVRGILTVVGLLALPASMGVAVFKYRLFDIDRIVSRTLGYAIVTGLLLGVYAGLVLLATRVLTVHAPVAVAAATLAAAALFTPVRRRVQRIVDHRFNRARYDADRTIAAFAGRLQDAVDLDTVRGDLLAAVHQALEPAHASVWLAGGQP